MNHPRRVVALVAAWAVGVAASFEGLRRYETTPGPAAESPSDWPAGCPIERRAGESTLLIFLHPSCPCSQATLDEMKAARQKGWSAAVHLVAVSPPEAPDGWEHGETWNAAQRFPNATFHVDRDGALARLFGAKTSGHAVLFDANGARRFGGGLTPTRGTDADGEVLLQAVRGAITQRAVFGCPLFDESCEADLCATR